MRLSSCLMAKWRLSFANHLYTSAAGEMFVVRKGVKHKPVAESECKLTLVEPCFRGASL
jgi:hypothetical protein